MQIVSPEKRGSSVVSALASRAKVTGIDPMRRQGNFGVRTRFTTCLDWLQSLVTK